MKTLRATHPLAPFASLCKHLLMQSLLWPSLLLAAPGCVVGEVDETANRPAEAAPSEVSILVYDPSKQGQVRSAMIAAGAEFVSEGYQAVIVDVGSASTATLAPIVERFLKDGKQVVLDSSDGPTDRIAIAELGAAVAGIALQESALSIVQNAPDAFTVTPIIGSSPSLIAAESNAGNSPLAVLGQRYSAPTSNLSAQTSVAGTTASASDTYVRMQFQNHGKPTPPKTPVLLDNNATYLETGFTGVQEKRYLYRGSPQACPASGTQVCEMSWAEQYARSITHGLNIGVTFSKVYEKLTGGVTLGYSLAVTNMKTLVWTTGASLNPGWTGRPVSYIWRRTGNGKVKNVYNFVSRESRTIACRPWGDCKRHYDTYVRQPDTQVGTWSAYVVLNQGDPTNSYNTFRGAADPFVYTFE
jgi:hypothetical protein